MQSRDTPLTIVSYFSNIRIVAVGVGSGHSIFLSQEGDLYSVGRGDDGRLGLNDTLWRHEPQKINYFSDNGIIVSSVACGSYHSCALSNGTLYTWCVFKKKKKKKTRVHCRSIDLNIFRIVLLCLP